MATLVIVLKRGGARINAVNTACSIQPKKNQLTTNHHAVVLAMLPDAVHINQAQHQTAITTHVHIPRPAVHLAHARIIAGVSLHMSCMVLRKHLYALQAAVNRCVGELQMFKRAVQHNSWLLNAG